MWLAAELSGQFEVLALDLPDTSGRQDFASLAEQLAPQLPDDGRPCLVLGESYSGPIALLLGQRYPQRVQGVILAASFANNPNPWVKAMPGLWAALFRRMWFRLWMGMWIPAGRWLWSMPVATKTAFVNVLKAIPSAILAERIVHSATGDVSGCLPLSQPLLYLRPTQDWVVSHRAVQQLQSLQPAMVIVHFKSPHLVLQCCPVEVAQAITDFYRRYCQPDG